MSRGSEPTREVVFIDGSEASSETIRHFYREILQRNFRPDELIEEEKFVADLCSPESGALAVIATSINGDLLGGFVADWYPRSRVLLLSYLAVKSELREHGLGLQLIEQAALTWIERCAPLLVVGEVEDPRHYASDQQYGDSWARLRLYERFGAKVLPLSYFQPALAPGKSRVRHMMLMTFWLNKQAFRAPGRVDGVIIEQFLEEYFVGCEGQADDQEIRRLRLETHVHGGLQLVAISAYLATTPDLGTGPEL